MRPWECSRACSHRKPPEQRFPHDVVDLEQTLPAAVAGRQLVRWSVRGDNFWNIVRGGRLRADWAPILAQIGLSLSDIEFAVAGRADSRRDPPYIIGALRLGTLRDQALFGPWPSTLAMDALNIDPNQGEDWRKESLAGKDVLVGHRGMVHQDSHQRGLPVVFVSPTTIYTVVSDDLAWTTNALTQLPAG